MPEMNSMEKIKNYWTQLQPREQMFVSAAMAFMVIFILYAGMWVPISSKIDKYAVSIPKKQQQLAQMRSQAVSIKSSAGNKSAVVSGNVLSRVEKLSQQYSLTSKIDSMEPQGENGVRLVIPEIEFEKYLEFISALTNHNMKIDSTTLDASDSPGIVSARIVISGN